MQKITRQSLYVLVVLFYLVSLAPPPAKITVSKATGNLREAVHTLQVLQENAGETATIFKNSLKYSIHVIQNVAGLKTVVFENQDPHNNNPATQVTITFRFTYLPENNFTLPAFKRTTTLGYPEYLFSHRSLRLPPDTPPPVAA